MLSVGVGDSAASVIGSRFGRLRFPDSSKTVEGAAASALAQLAFLWLLSAAGALDPSLAAWSGLWPPVCAVALLEAVTSQVDNLVLPAVMYIML